MENKYYLTGVQLAMLMRDTNEKDRMETLQKIMDNQCMNSQHIKSGERKAT